MTINSNGVHLFNYTGIDEVVKRLIAMTDGERATVARELAERDPHLADGLADLLIDSVYDALREKKPIDASTVKLLQEAAATIEAERRRQYRAEMAQELRRLFRERQGRVNYPGRSQMAQGIDAGLELAIDIIDTMSPPVVCDEPTK